MLKRNVKFKAMILTLVLGSIAAFLCAFFVGSSGFSFREFAQVVDGSASSAVSQIFFNIRLPRAIGAFFVGAALAVSGCCLQGVFKNPMADPFVLGISSGAALGATIAMTFVLGTTLYGAGTIAVMSFAGALLAIFVVYNISRIRGKVSTFSLLLSGFAISALLSALIYLIMLLNRDKMENVILWNMGSLANMTWDKIWIAMPAILVCSTLLMFYAKPLNILLNGDEVSRSLGVDTHKTRRNMLILTSLLSAVAVSISGVIGFVGLMVPHMLRMVAGPDNRRLLPLCFVGGGMYLLFCDVIARIVLPGQELPVGIVTAILGVPFFVFLLRRGKKGGV
ncbi:MAG: iron ABC transporter permease [Christensenella sp.]|nr:iron ABC transporter permease [Christensenella sp.]